jgi:hypothetical protein
MKSDRRLSREMHPPRLGRLLLRLRRLGARRAEIEADLHELFRQRVVERDHRYAALRYCLDAASLWIHRPDGIGRSPKAPDGRPVPGRGAAGPGLGAETVTSIVRGPRWLDVLALDLRYAVWTSATPYGRCASSRC